MKRLIAGVAIFLLGCASSDQAVRYDRTAYVGARVFDGERFQRRDIVVEGARIVDSPASTASNRIDVSGRYIVPPFCEAHNHNLGDADRNDEAIAQYLREGIFYVGILSNLPRLTDPVRHTYNTPSSVDVIFANGPITATGGHPIRIRELFLARGFYPGFTRETLPGQGYVVIDNEVDLERQWPAIVALRPDFIKIILIYSEEFARRRDDAEYFGYKGLDPALVPRIVERAHGAGLRVFAHIDTAHDFHVAVESGVDVIAHLGGFNEPMRIDGADARLAAERGVQVMTTTAVIERRRERVSAEAYAALQNGLVENLRLLREAGVTLAVGSDEPRATSSIEVSYLRGLNVFSNAELLRMWSSDCSATLFPERRLGRLEPGFEASFLVLNGNPLANFDNTASIAMRVKEGQILNVPPPPAEDDE
ncbi:MAG: amidohydrolase family protein [Steroidobacteraceae bacterium]